MSDFYDKYVQQVLTAVQQILAQTRANTPPNPTTAVIASASIDSEGVRTITVNYGGATDIPTMWGTAFDMAIQVMAGDDLSKLQDPEHPIEVLLVTSTSPAYISDMIVRS